MTPGRPGIGSIIVAGAERGTGFAVSETLVLTAFHCVRDNKTESPSGKPIAFRLLGGGDDLRATVSEWDKRLDFALLQLDVPLPAAWERVAIGAAGESVEGAPFRSKGFPNDRPFTEASFAVHGSIVDIAAERRGGAPALQLYCEEVAAARDPGGLSGAPVQISLRTGWLAVGLVCWSQPRPGENRLGFGGTVYASPLEAIAAASPTVSDLCVEAQPPSEGPAKNASWPDGYPMDFAEELAEAAEFVGREEQLAQIQLFADEHECGYVHLEASAGLGKSALAARFAALEQAPAFFADVSRGSVQPAHCLQHLSTELVLRHNLDPGLVGPETGVNSRAFSTILEAVSQQRSDSVWLVVDGLDEAEPATAGANPLLLPPRLPPGVFILVTSRGPATELFTERPTSRGSLVLSAEGEAERRDLELYVEYRLQKDERLRAALAQAAPPLEAAEFARQIAASAEGNFMYVTYVLEDFAEGKLDLDSRPEALDGYYEVRFWRPMEEDRERDPRAWGELQRPVLERLAVAAEPVSADWLAAQVGQPAAEVTDRVLRPWQRFLRNEHQDGRERWRVIHRSFADFLGGKLDLAGANRAVADAGRENVDGYARRHLAEHLRAGGDLQGLIALADDPDWEAEQLAASPSGRLLVHDFEQVWLAVEEKAKAAPEGEAVPDLIALQAWCMLAVASVRTRVQAVAPTLIAALVEEELWTLERARETVRQSPDPAHRALGLLALRRWEPALLEEALVAAEEIPWIQKRVKVKIELAKALPEDRRQRLVAAMLDEAKADAVGIRQLLRELPDESLPTAFEIAEGFSSTIDQCLVFLPLAHRHGRAVAESEVARRALSSEGLPESLLDVLAIDPGKAEAATEAAALLESLAAGNESFWQGFHRNPSWVIEALIPRLDAEALRKMVERTAKNGWFTPDAEEIAIRLALAGDPDAALDAIALSSFSEQGQALARLCRHLPASAADRALELAEGPLSPYERGEGLAAIAGMLPPAGRSKLLADAIPDTGLDDDEAKAEALLGFAPYLEPERAAEAYRYLTEGHGYLNVVRGIAALAPALPEELLHAARLLAEETPDEYDGNGRAAIVQRLGGEGLIEAAETAAWDRHLQPSAAVALVRRLDEAGRERMVGALPPAHVRQPVTAVLALAPYLSENQAAELQPRLGEADQRRFTALREVSLSANGFDAANLARSIVEAQSADELTANAVALLVERGRADDALELAGALNSNAVGAAVLGRLRSSRQPVCDGAFELALSLTDWESCLLALIGMADDFDGDTLREACRRLEEDAARNAAEVNDADRQTALMQYRASLLPLYARLPSEERAGLVAELESFCVEAGWHSALGVLHVINPEAEPMPPDVAAFLYAALGRLLHELSAQPRSLALSYLPMTATAMIGVAGTRAAAESGAKLLDACERWP
jgi:hypothetical protein